MEDVRIIKNVFIFLSRGMLPSDLAFTSKHFYSINKKKTKKIRQFEREKKPFTPRPLYKYDPVRLVLVRIHPASDQVQILSSQSLHFERKKNGFFKGTSKKKQIDLLCT